MTIRPICETITPEVVATIMRRANPAYAVAHQHNAMLPDVSACTLGTVFVSQAGDYAVYTGLDPRDRKLPVRFTTIDERTPKRGRWELMAKIAKAAREMSEPTAA